MTSIKRASLLAGAATLTLTGGSFADTAVEAQNEELRSRIAQLEGRLADVEAQGNDNWLTERRADEIRSVVEDVLADADTRSSMLAQGMTAGYDDGAVIASADGNWLLRTNLLLQTRFMFNNQEAAPSGASDSTVWGFEVTRAKFMLSGNVVSPEWFYRVDIETSPNASGAVGSSGDPRFGLLEAYAGYDFGNGWKLYGGQFKAPLLFEELVEDQYQQAVERSLVNYLYTGGYTQGIAVDYLGDQFHVVGSWNNGINDVGYGGGVGVGAGGAALGPDTELAFTARGEWLAMGTWDQFKDITSPQGEEMGVRVGGAWHFQTSESGGGVAGKRTELMVFALDASAEFGGANVYAQLSYSIENYKSPAVGPTGIGANAKPWGIVLGGGWYWTEDWELFGRYEWSDRGALGTAGNPDNINILTFGVNKYFAGHNAKWTTDIGIGLTTLDGLAGTSTGAAIAPVTGWRQDNAGTTNDDGQILIRTQLQILF